MEENWKKGFVSKKDYLDTRDKLADMMDDEKLVVKKLDQAVEDFRWIYGQDLVNKEALQADLGS